MELFKLFGTIAVDNSAANNGIDETTGKAEQAHPRISAAFAKVGAAAVKVGAMVASGLAAGAAAVGALAKSSLDSYADYEQLAGGVETLFKDSSEKVKAYAQNAYSTASMSANEYMETVTSFSASLLQGLGGDTDKAAEVANRAITDMSDNANKMGTDMSMIQNAYQGFAKQNYTMLDNLKLGYGGTQAEMARLINDSGVLGNSIKVTAETVNTVSFDKIIEAIGVVQDRMGITGTTAREASETISGSLASTKAAWQNLLTGFADGSQDLNALVGNLMTSATTAAKNIVPRIAQILTGISAASPQIMEVIAAELPVFMESLLPGLISGAVSLVVGLGEMIPSLVEMLFSDLPYLLSEALANSTNPVISQVGETLLTVGEFWREIISPAISDVGGAFGSLVAAIQPVLSVFPALFAETTGVNSGLDLFRTMCFGVESALNFVSEKVSEVASGISGHAEQIKAVITGIWEAAVYIWDSVGQPMWDMVQSCVASVVGVFQEKMPEIKEFVSRCFDDIEVFWNEHLKPCFDAIGDFIENVLAPIFNTVFNTTIKGAVDTAFQAIESLWNNTLKPVFTGITDFLTGVFTGDWEKAWNGILDVFKGIINLIPTALESVINGAIDLVNALIEGVNAISSSIGVPPIELIGHVKLPKLEKGGVLEKGQIGILEGNGAEAVVPLDQNKKWISAVADDMGAAIGGNGSAKEIQELREVVRELMDDLPGMMVDAFASMKFEINNREFARLTAKAVN